MPMKAIFLDRDGVINKNPGDKKYVTRWGNFSFLPGAKKAIANLYKNNYKIFIVSNQAGVGKGIFSKKSLGIITEKMLRQIRKNAGDINGVNYCIHRPQARCLCRKPKAGSIKRIARRYRIRLKAAFLVGDTIRDVQTARNAGCRSILVLSGKEKLKNRKHWQYQPDLVFRNLLEASKYILRKKR